MMRLLAALALMWAIPWLAGGLLPMRAVWTTRWACGVLAVSAAAALPLAAGAPMNGGVVFAAVLAAAGALGHWRRRRSGDPGHVRSRPERVLAAVLVLIGAATAAVTLAQPVDEFDAMAIWFNKVRAIGDDQPLAALPVANYPTLGAIAWALGLAVAGDDAEPVGRLVFPALYLAWMSSLRELLPRPITARAALIVAAVAVAFLDHRVVTSGLQDPTIMSVAGLAAACLTRSTWAAASAQTRAESGRWAMLGAFFAGSLAWIKVDGAMLGAAIVLIWLAAAWHERRHGGVLARLGPLVVFAGLAMIWPGLMAAHGLSTPEMTAWVPIDLSAAGVLSRVDRLAPIVNGLLGLTGTFMLPVAAALVISASTWAGVPRWRGFLLWMWSVAALHWVFIAAAFVISTAPIEWHLASGLRRMVFQQGFVYVTIVAVGLHALTSPAPDAREPARERDAIAAGPFSPATPLP